MAIVCPNNLATQTVHLDSSQVSVSTQASVQPQRTAWNTIHLELLGTGILYSVSYEGFISNHLALRLGFGIVPSLFTLFPITVSGFIGREEHRFEIGAGYLAATSTMIHEERCV
jgi:hypothetical protein